PPSLRDQYRRRELLQSSMNSYRGFGGLGGLAFDTARAANSFRCGLSYSVLRTQYTVRNFSYSLPQQLFAPLLPSRLCVKKLDGRTAFPLVHANFDTSGSLTSFSNRKITSSVVIPSACA